MTEQKDYLIREIEKISFVITGNNSTINLSQLAQGIYYYRIMNNGVSIKSDKIVRR